MVLSAPKGGRRQAQKNTGAKNVKQIYQPIITMILAMGLSTAHAFETIIDFEDQTAVPVLAPKSEYYQQLTIQDEAGLNAVTFESLNSFDSEYGFIISEDSNGNNYLRNGFLGYTELKISFLNPVDTFSFYFDNSRENWEVEVFNTQNLSIGTDDLINPDTGEVLDSKIFEFSNLSGISYATLTQTTSGFGADISTLDNVTYTTSIAAIPEPSTYALMLGGLGMVGFMAHRRRKAMLNSKQ